MPILYALHYILWVINIKIMNQKQEGESPLFLQIFILSTNRGIVCMRVNCSGSNLCNFLHAVLAQHWECMKTNYIYNLMKTELVTYDIIRQSSIPKIQIQFLIETFLLDIHHLIFICFLIKKKKKKTNSFFTVLQPLLSSMIWNYSQVIIVQ